MALKQTNKKQQTNKKKPILMVLSLRGILELLGKLILLLFATGTSKDKDHFIIRNHDMVVS